MSERDDTDASTPWGKVAWDCGSANHCSRPGKVVELCAPCFSAALDAARAEGKAEGAAAEREACAEVAEFGFLMNRRPLGSPGTFEYDIDVAAAIRSRGDA